MYKNVKVLSNVVGTLHKYSVGSCNTFHYIQSMCHFPIDEKKFLRLWYFLRFGEMRYPLNENERIKGSKMLYECAAQKCENVAKQLMINKCFQRLLMDQSNSM